MDGLVRRDAVTVWREWHLGNTVRDVVEHVEPGDALREQLLGCEAIGLLKDCSEHVARVNFVFTRTLYMQHCCL